MSDIVFSLFPCICFILSCDFGNIIYSIRSFLNEFFGSWYISLPDCSVVTIDGRICSVFVSAGVAMVLFLELCLIRGIIIVVYGGIFVTCQCNSLAAFLIYLDLFCFCV